MSEQNPELREDDKKPQGVLSGVGSNSTPGSMSNPYRVSRFGKFQTL
jgi:hypothetical protein